MPQRYVRVGTSGLPTTMSGQPEISDGIDDMEFEESTDYNNTNLPLNLDSTVDKMIRFRDQINDNIITPVREKIVNPLSEIQNIFYSQCDYYLNKIGNPLLLKRFFYICFMTFVMWYVFTNESIPNGIAQGSDGLFSDNQILTNYSRNMIDLAKLETDLEYLARVPHMSGTKGDTFMRKYIKDSLQSFGLLSVYEKQFTAYANYPNTSTLMVYRENNELLEIKLNERNFNPLSSNGNVSSVTLLYGYMGTRDHLQSLRDISLLDDDFVLLLHYSDLVSEQVMTAQKFGAKGIIFISDEFANNEEDIIQGKSVNIPQFGTGDVLSPGWASNKVNLLNLNESKALPQIPVLPLSMDQGSLLLSTLAHSGIKFDNGKYSGIAHDIKIDLVVNTVVKERQPIHNIIGKIEGRDQKDKAIIIGSSRNSLYPGALYPNFGTSSLLQIARLLQELKYRFNWIPLRSIYLISYGGSEFNFAGSTEQYELEALPIQNEIYQFIDVTQLGVTDTLDIQCHPLLYPLFRDLKKRNELSAAIHDVQQYGDWTPFLANGIPVTVFASDNIRQRTPPIDTHADSFQLIHEMLMEEKKQERVVEMFSFIIQAVLKIVDDPLIPYDIQNYVKRLDRCMQSLGRKYKQSLEFNGIIKGLLDWKKVAQRWGQWKEDWNSAIADYDGDQEPARMSRHRWKWNEKLSEIGRKSCYEYGLPSRDFYKNVLFGPPLWTDGDDPYPWSYPGIKDAIQEGDFETAQVQIDVIGSILHSSADDVLK